MRRKKGRSLIEIKPVKNYTLTDKKSQNNAFNSLKATHKKLSSRKIHIKHLKT